MLILNPFTIIIIGAALLVFGTHPVVTLVGFMTIAIPVTVLIVNATSNGGK
jgi:hypothetical protein